MKFPSVKTLAEGAKNTISRFPLEVAFALAGTIAAIVYIELNYIQRVAESWCIRIMLSANIGLLLCLSATLHTERYSLKGKKAWLLKMAAVLITVTLLFILKPQERHGDWVRFFLISLALHLLVAFAAFTKKGSLQGFWQFNKALFLRFLTSALYSLVLYAGIAAALGACNFLFNFKFEWDTFAILGACIAGLFSTIFFLAGVPADYSALDEDTSYPKGLKIFTQYVLIPLASLYVLILLAYEARILINWNLPKGLVSNIVLAYAVFGILALLLVYPIKDREENKWLKTYTRSFYFLMLPLLALLFLATGTRVFSYGITVPRYFLMMLAIWLLLISLYFLISKKQNIKIIPISLSLLTLLTIYGPQSAFSVSEYSQTRILVSIFKKNNSYKNGKLQPIVGNKISNKDGSKAVAQLEYIVDNFDITALQPYIKKDLTAVSDSLSSKKSEYRSSFLIDRYLLRSEKQKWLQKHLGLEKFSRYDEATTVDNWNFNAPGSPLVIKDYDYLLDADYTDTLMVKLGDFKFKRSVDNTFDYGKDEIEKRDRHKLPYYNIILDNENISFDLKELANELMKRKDLARYKDSEGYYDYNYHLPQDFLMQTKTMNGFKVTLFLTNMSVTKDEGRKKELSIVSASGNYLIKKRK